MRRTIEVSTNVRATFVQAYDVLAGDPCAVVAEAGVADGQRERRVHTMLGVDVGSGGRFEQRIMIDLGVIRSTADGVELPVRWRAVPWERVFPSFDGILEVAPAETGSSLVLRGAYAVPLGPLGGFGDGIVGRRVARASLSAFLEEAARRLDDEVDRRLHVVLPVPPSYRVAVREVGAETFVG